MRGIRIFAKVEGTEKSKDSDGHRSPLQGNEKTILRDDVSASDPNLKPDPVSTPEALAGGQRTLAAIVFTDTVNFSKLMSQDEERAMRLVARDLPR